MTLEQIGAVMDVLTVAYPQYYRNITEDDKFKSSLLWAEMFYDDPVEVVVAAVKAFISTDEKGFPPHIGAIKNQIVNITSPPQKSELEAWAEVKKALSNSGYHAAEEFDKLDAAMQRIIGAPSQLREWALADIETLDSVIASNFQRSYRAVSKTQREQKVLPSAVSEFVNLLAGKMDMEQPEPKALPISVKAELEKIKREVGQMPVREMPAPLSDEEFEKKRAEILAQMT